MLQADLDEIRARAKCIATPELQTMARECSDLIAELSRDYQSYGSAARAYAHRSMTKAEQRRSLYIGELDRRRYLND